MAEDPYKYFRIESHDLVNALGQGVLLLEKGGNTKELVTRLLRQAHTLKGAARIVKQPRISDLSHAVEEILSPYREGLQPIPHERFNELLRLLDSIAACVRSLNEPEAEPSPPVSQSEPSATAAPAEDRFETVRMETRDMDSFLSEISQAGVHVSALRRESTTIGQSVQMAATLIQRASSVIDLDKDSAAASAQRIASTAHELRSSLRRLQRTLDSGIEQAERELAKALDRACDLRLQPASTIFPSLERAARDAAESLDKDITFVTSGGEHRLDAHVLRAVRDALVHVVRNAVAHGIEPAASRVAAGKPPAGRIELHVDRRTNHAIFTCIDDGQGIDIDEVRRIAVERGAVSSAEAQHWDRRRAMEYVLGGGVSTKRSVTQVSGRGIGLEVLRDTVAWLKGQVTAHSEPSGGMTLQISVPISLESLAVLEVEAGGATVSIPFDAIQIALRVANGDIARSPQGSSILHEGNATPFLPLAQLLRPQMAPAASPRFWSVIIVQSGGAKAAIGVERVLRRASVVVRPLPAGVGKCDLLTGASFDSQGNPQLVLDAAGVIAAVAGRRVDLPEERPPAKRPVLVIDDSLTTRMLEQSILETAGFEVDLAVSGEQGLEKARQRRYCLFVVDVEMPGMSGFRFIELTQADFELRAIPAILVTSRSAAEDRLHGERVGARAYMVKSDFDEGQLLGTIRRLIH